MSQLAFNNEVGRMSRGEDLFGMLFINLMMSSVVRALNVDKADPENVRWFTSADTASTDDWRDACIDSRMPVIYQQRRLRTLSPSFCNPHLAYWCEVRCVTNVCV